jgi:hypothetical protein
VSPSPLLFKEGTLRLNEMIPFLSGADGVVSKMSRSCLMNGRAERAPIAAVSSVKINSKGAPFARPYKDASRPFTNHPVCANKEGDILLRRSHPSLKTEGNGAVSELASFPHMVRAGFGAIFIL